MPFRCRELTLAAAGNGGLGVRGGAAYHRRATNHVPVLSLEISMKLASLVIIAFALCSPRVAVAQVFVAPPPPPLSIPDIIWNSHMMRHLGNAATGQAAFAEQLKRDLAKRNAAPGGGAAPSGSATPSYSAELSYPFSGTHVL